MRAAWLIAGREFRAYTTTASFWIAAALGPMLLGGGVLLAKPPAADSRASGGFSLSRAADGVLEARFSDRFPATADGRTRILEAVEKEVGPVRPAPAPRKTPAETTDPSRLALTTMLWITLTGALGMLLQAVVRERANRALESLLASTDPWSVVGGKILGVGAVSLLVVGVWLGSAVALGATNAAASGAMSVILEAFVDPLFLLRAVAVYLLAFLFFGFAIVGVGAQARDSADAQNLARPVFAVLLAVFFVIITDAGAKMSWLVYLPPLTPFLILMETRSVFVEIVAIGGLTISTVAAAWFAGLALQSDGFSHLFRVRRNTLHSNNA